MKPWTVGDIIETRAGLWELAYIGITTYVLRNDSGRLHIVMQNEIDKYCKRVDV